jgi:sterol desaturase/sphingolipid hydroxylase (fatty acid hydroxylase superfamily)
MWSNEAMRLAVALGVLGLFGIAQWLWPRDAIPPRRVHFAATNLALGVLSAALVRVLLPWLAVDAARWSQQHGFGLLHALSMPPLLAVVSGLLLLDLALYVQHVLMHRVRWLWRLHAVHHCDAHLDVTTGYRFHPLEIVVSMLWKIALVTLAGIGPLVVIGFEIWLNAMSIITHANLRLPPWLECGLRRVLVTPDVHRIHHSIVAAEQNCNLGFDLTLWDRVFGTFRSASVLGSRGALGVDRNAADAKAGLWMLIRRPFNV